jgi:hypothetical protein
MRRDSAKQTVDEEMQGLLQAGMLDREILGSLGGCPELVQSIRRGNRV